MKIKNLFGKKILDSRGQETIEVFLITQKGEFCACVPSGLSKGKFEAKVVPVEVALRNIREIILPSLKEKEFSHQSWFDDFLIKLDGEKDKSRLGANTILGCSMAFSRAMAAERGVSLYEYIGFLAHDDFSKNFSLPRPCFNILEGGRHAQNELNVQEFLVVPKKKSFSENLALGRKIYERLKNLLKEKFDKEGIVLGHEGGFAPPIKKTFKALSFLRKAITHEGAESECDIALDVAANEFFKDGKYIFEGEDFDLGKMLKFYEDLLTDNSILFLEDPFGQEDFEGWREAMERFSSKVLIVGDDLIATNPERIKFAKQSKLCNGIILKPNQIGTVTEAIEAARLAKGAGWKVIVSHRSGETMDDFIADFAVGVGAEFVKSGAPGPRERMVKYERLREIEKALMD